MTHPDTWDHFVSSYVVADDAEVALDTSRVAFPAGFIDARGGEVQAAMDAMEQLERGAIANPDEQRMVGHYWLRDASLAPTPELARAISETVDRVVAFAGRVRDGSVASASGRRFTDALVIGIGGSALGPQLAASALGHAGDELALSFFDNTDPDGFDRVLARLGDRLATTLVVVTSKSGGTKETRNGMLEAKAALERRGLVFGRHAVAITGEGSALDRFAVTEGFLERFPMWDWVGGRTSELSAVGLLPASLAGVDVRAMLDGARAMDVATRARDPRQNPAAMLALAWLHETGGRGQKDMVILPYKDRLELTSRYLQQLVMESLGKERDLRGQIVNQGIAVYGNKGSTDQHAYVQQLRDGVNNFFAVFIEVRRDRAGASMEVEPGVTSGDYLTGFLLGTRRALHENGRGSITITLDQVTPRSLGALIALFERAVGLYASLVGVNAYHQPGVEAGKKAAADVLALQHVLVAALTAEPQSARELARAAGAPAEGETAFYVLSHLADNARGVARTGGRHPSQARFHLARSAS